MRASGREAIRTALALGHQLVPILGNERVEANDPDHYANVLLDSVLSGWTRPNTRVTVLQDWMKGRRAEVDDINGLVVREQQRLGGSAPINAALVEIAYRIESGELEASPANAGLLTALLESAGRQR
jgi:2-dehydropantoate 2-reductase